MGVFDGVGISGDWTPLRQMMKLPDPPQDAHVACACRMAITMCGLYRPKATGVDRVKADSINPRTWCAECLTVWRFSGCGNCGCGPGNLCDGCQQSPAV